MKHYQFKPNLHWNYISADVYVVLVKFYDESRIRSFMKTDKCLLTI